MSDDQTRPTEPDAPTPPPAAPAYGGTPAYDVPAPVYAPRPRFADQVLGMRAVVAVALACLIVGGLSGFVLGHLTGDDRGRFGGGPAGFPNLEQRGTFPGGPGGMPGQPFGQGQNRP